MLEKITGVRNIHLLRITGLVKSDYNCGLKVFYVDRLMKNAKETVMSSNQWGGCTNRSAPAFTTRRLMTFESTRIMHKTIPAGSADKSNCFDDLTPTLTDAVNKKKGMDGVTCRCDNRVMEGIKCNIITSFGISKSSYSTNPGDTQHSGNIQGKASVVGEWTLIAKSILVPYETKMREAGNFFTMISADYGITTEQDMQLDCPSVAHWDYVVTFAAEVRF